MSYRFLDDVTADEEPKQPNPYHTPEEEAAIRIKVAFCQVCGRWFKMAGMPQAEIDKDTAKEFRQYALDGDRIDIVPLLEARQMEGCQCPYPEPKKKKRK